MTTSKPAATAHHEPSLLDPPRTRREKRSVLLYSGIWLVFFAWTVGGIITSDAAIIWQVLAWISLVAFIVIYLISFLHPEPITSLSRTPNIALYTVILAGLALVMSQTTHYAIVNAVPFLMALWLFNHRLRAGLIGVAIISVTVLTLVVLFQVDAFRTWLLPAVGVPAIVLVMVRSSIEFDENNRIRSERLALADQREELAGTVHDVLGHSLTTITVKAQLAQRLVTTDPAQAEAELDGILALSRRSLSEVRAAVTDLRQPDLTEQLDQAEQSLEAGGTRLHRPSELPRLTLVQQQVFAWVLREAVTNVIRHSGAKNCRVSVTTEDEVTTMAIDDDGVGIETEPIEHNGLNGLRRRVESAGGQFTVTPLNPGTRVKVVL